LKVGNLKKSLQNVMRLYLPSSGSLNASRVTWPPPTGGFPLGHLSGFFCRRRRSFLDHCCLFLICRHCSESEACKPSIGAKRAGAKHLPRSKAGARKATGAATSTGMSILVGQPERSLEV
jgi:hypothetical protein